MGERWMNRAEVVVGEWRRKRSSAGKRRTAGVDGVLGRSPESRADNAKVFCDYFNGQRDETAERK